MRSACRTPLTWRRGGVAADRLPLATVSAVSAFQCCRRARETGSQLCAARRPQTVYMYLLLEIDDCVWRMLLGYLEPLEDEIFM